MSTEQDVYYKDCSSNFRSKHSTNIVLCLLRKLLEQSLIHTYLVLFLIIFDYFKILFHVLHVSTVNIFD